MPYLVTCPNCNVSAVMDGDQLRDPDAGLDCDPDGNCCLKDHHHGMNAEHDPASHPGECGVGNPDCPICRPLVITPLPGSANVSIG